MDIDPLTIGEMPQGYAELPDGSVVISEEKIESVENDDFLENLAEVIEESELCSIAFDLIELIKRDKDSRKKRDKQYEEGLRRTGLGDDAPGGAEFSGASRVVHPVLAEACVDFSSRAIKELFPASGPVKPWTIGKVTPQKTEKATRKTKFMNWQLTTQIKEYRDELEQLLTQLPMGGSQYQKFWYDDRLRRPRCDFVPIDEVFLPFAANNFYTAQRVTHCQPITKAELHRRVDSGLYRDVFVGTTQSYPDQSLAATANDKIEGREEDGYNEDGIRNIYEVYCWLEIGEDPLTEGFYAPYVITIDEDTEKVFSLYRNWKEGDNTFEKLDWFVEWKFIPWRGAYAIGLPHLIGGISAALTGALRALLDSAHINNAATMMKLRSGRVVGQNTEVSVTQICDIEGPAGIDDIRKVAMPMPFNPPSPVLAGLMDTLYGLAKGVVATANDNIANVGDRTPVGTTMALVEQGSNTYSAIHARLHESQKKALEILHRIDATFLEDQAHLEELGEDIVSLDDFQGSMDVIPVSDPTIFSEAQRFAQTQAIVQMSADQSVPWNKVNVYRRALKQMRVEDIDNLLPPNKDPVTADLLTENVQALSGFPLKAVLEQDHMSHIRGHLAFVMSPLQMQNPLTPPQALMALIAHINEHIGQLQQRVAVDSTVGDSEADILAGMEQAAALLANQLGPVIQVLSRVVPEIQKKMPQPPMPPEVQASIQIAQMDIQRKSQYDQAMLQNKQAEQQAKQQMDQAVLQMEQAQVAVSQQMDQMAQQFNQYIEQQRLQQENQLEQLRQQVEMMNNEADNHQKQMTELLKNRDDNDTKVMIEQMKAQLTSVQESMGNSGERAPDLNPQLQQMQTYLDQIGKQQTNDALSSVMEGLKATIETLNKPKTIIRDEQGRAQGIQ